MENPVKLFFVFSNKYGLPKAHVYLEKKNVCKRNLNAKIKTTIATSF